MEIKEVPLDQLKPDPANARKHSDRNIEEIIRSLKEFGQHAPLVVQKGTNRIIVGNGRYEAMQMLGWDKAYVVYVDDDNVTAVRRALADNRTAELAEWDDEALARLLEGLGEEALRLDKEPSGKNEKTAFPRFVEYLRKIGLEGKLEGKGENEKFIKVSIRDASGKKRN
jgi:ParB-like chromosome segregation protein Spo0J